MYIFLIAIKPHVSTYDKEISSHSDVYYSDEEGSA